MDTVTFECMCGKSLRVDKRLVGKMARCPGCGVTVRIPDSNGVALPPEAAKPTPTAQAPQTPQATPSPAVIPQMQSQPIAVASPQAPSSISAHTKSLEVPAIITTPLLVSAIINCIAAGLWLVTIFGVIFAAPLIVLLIYEFKLHADLRNRTQFVPPSRVKTIAICEIVAGLVNLASLVCGIIILTNLSDIDINSSGDLPRSSAPASGTAAAPLSGNASVQIRLQKLAELKTQGLITDEEYSAKRTEILWEL